MNFGSLAHVLVFEPHHAKNYRVIDNSVRRGSRSWEESKAEGKIPVKKSDWEEANLLAKNVRAHPLLKHIFQDDGLAEESVFWTDQQGLKCKARFDYRVPKHKCILDLKTTKDANPHSRFGFIKSIQNYRYDIQAAHYLEAAKALTKEDYTFLFVAVENKAPYAVSVSVIDDEDLEKATDELQTLKRKISEHKTSNIWPSWDPIIHVLKLKHSGVLNG